MTTKFTDIQLKKALVKMLPDQLTIEESNLALRTLDEALDIDS